MHSTLKDFIAQTPDGERRDEVLNSCVNMAIGSGTPLKMISKYNSFILAH